MKSTDDYPAGVYQSVIAVYLTLMQIVQMARPDGSLVLDSRNSSSHLRHYGYVICHHMVYIWEMSIERPQEAIPTDNMSPLSLQKTSCIGCVWGGGFSRILQMARQDPRLGPPYLFYAVST